MRKTLDMLSVIFFKCVESLYMVFNATASFLSTMPRRVLHYALPSLVAIVIMLTVTFTSGMTMALEVEYGGEDIGCISSEEVFMTAISDIENKIEGDSSEYLHNYNFSLKLSSAGRLLDADSLTDAIVSNTESLVAGAGLYIGGELVLVCADAPSLQTAIDAFIVAGSNSNAFEECSLSGGYEVIDGFYDASFSCDVSNVRDVLNARGTKVVVAKTETYLSEVPFENITIESDSYAAGKTILKVAGKPGRADVTARVEYIDGIEVSRTILSSNVLESPINEELIVGTKKVTSSTLKPSVSMVWPLERVARSYISSYWGDGRGHKGLDICAPRGTQVHAALGGTVTKVTYTNDYGYHIVINHGNGMQTLYAHNSSNAVSVGQKVSAGETIAYVGRTGDASGNHVHFEVWLNGTRVNPAPYLGI